MDLSVSDDVYLLFADDCPIENNPAGRRLHRTVLCDLPRMSSEGETIICQYFDMDVCQFSVVVELYAVSVGQYFPDDSVGGGSVLHGAVLEKQKNTAAFSGGLFYRDCNLDAFHGGSACGRNSNLSSDIPS